MSDALKTTIDPEEASRFEKIAELWWNLDGPFWPLHRMNQLRSQWIKAQLLSHFRLSSSKSEKPLSGLRMLDIGCGGGILSEAMARLGASVTGIDVVDRNLKIASRHAQMEGLPIDYRCIAVEDLARVDMTFDVVLNMEVVEHVSDLPLFLKSSAKLVRPGGMMIVATLNRTLLSYLVAIIGAEYLFGWLPKGTHQWRKFVRPGELDSLLTQEGLDPGDSTGVWMNPWARSFLTVPSKGVNYIRCFTRGQGLG